MIKLFILFSLLGYTLACITINIKYNNPTSVDVVAVNNTISICNSTLNVENNVITCGNNSNNITISNNRFKISTGKHVTGWKQLLNAKGPKGNIVQFGQYNCNKLG